MPQRQRQSGTSGRSLGGESRMPGRNCRIFSVLLFAIAILIDDFSIALFADGPTDNSVQSVRPIPPPGIKIDDEARLELQSGLERLQAKIAELRQSKNSTIVQYLPDVEIFEKAIRTALSEDGFFEPRELDSARNVLSVGMERAEELKPNSIPSWLGIKGNAGFTVRGYRSKLDGSVQPYGIAWNQPTGRGDI